MKTAKIAKVISLTDSILKVVKDFKENLDLDLIVDLENPTARLKRVSPRSRAGFKQIWGYRFRDKEQMLNFISENYETQIKNKERKQAEKLEKKERIKKDLQDVKVGDIFLCSWGYEQTNVNFYKLIELKNTKGVFQEIGYNHVRETSWCSADVEIDETQIIGEPFVKMLKGASFKRNSFSYAYKVDKTKTFYTSWGY